MRVSARIADQIRRWNLSQKEAAKRLGTHQPIINHIENGRNTISLEQLLTIWERCGGGYELILREPQTSSDG